MENNNEKNGTNLITNVINVPTKTTINQIKDLVRSEELSPAYIGVVLKKFSKIAEEIKKDKEIQGIIEFETKKYQEGTVKTFACYGAKVTIANRGYWDYSKTEDPVLRKLGDIEKHVKEQIKLRKEELQSKALALDSKNNPLNVQKFGIQPFTVTFDSLPEFSWIEGAGEIETLPPTKRVTESLRYSL